MSTDQHETAVVTYVRYLLPGAFVPEETVRTVNSRDPRAAARRASPDAYAFEFFDRATAAAEVGGHQVQMNSRALNESGTYYIDGETLTATGVAALPGDHRILLANMRSNGWEHVVRCRAGNFQPFRAGDEIVSSH